MRTERMDPGANRDFDVYALRQSRLAFGQSCKPEGWRLGTGREAIKAGWRRLAPGSSITGSMRSLPCCHRMMRKVEFESGRQDSSHSPFVVSAKSPANWPAGASSRMPCARADVKRPKPLADTKMRSPELCCLAECRAPP